MAKNSFSNDMGFCIAGYNQYQTEWDILIAVTYRAEKGYDEIQTEFEEIRALHKRVLIDGLDFSDLGKIISRKHWLEIKIINGIPEISKR